MWLLVCWERSRGAMLCRARVDTVTATVTPCTSASPRKTERDITMLDFFTLCDRYTYTIHARVEHEVVCIILAAIYMAVLQVCFSVVNPSCGIY